MYESTAKEGVLELVLENYHKHKICHNVIKNLFRKKIRARSAIFLTLMELNLCSFWYKMYRHSFVLRRLIPVTFDIKTKKLL